MADPLSYAEAMQRLAGGGRRLGVNFSGAVRHDGVMTQETWIHIANSESKTARTLTIPKGLGIDTIFVIDISESMRGRPYEQAVNVVLTYLDIIENVNKKHRLSESVALVTVGHKTEVLHHLTCDYWALRTSLGSIQVGGRTPMIAGLFMALSAINGRGSISVMNGCHVYPRIILLTDSMFTDSDCTTGPDSSMYEQQEIDDEILNLAVRLGAEHHNIHCINVGDKENPEILRKLAEVSDGSVTSYDAASVKSLGRHFKNMAAVTRMRRHFSLNWKNRREFENVVTSYENDVDQSDIDDMMYLLQYKLADVVQEDVEFMDGSAPNLGTRVMRGPQWDSGNEDGEGPGTIVKHSRKPGHVTVEWDLTRIRKEYSYHDGKKQVKTSFEQRILMEDDLIAPGCLVCRGDDWQWGFQDGGPENVGVVYDVQQSGLVHVRWPNGHCNWYRFGAEGMFDVQIWEPAGDGNDPVVPSTTIYTRDTALPPKTHNAEVVTSATILKTTPVYSLAASSNITPVSSLAASSNITPVSYKTVKGSLAASSNITPVSSLAASSNITPVKSRTASSNITSVRNLAASSNITPVSSLMASSAADPDKLFMDTPTASSPDSNHHVFRPTVTSAPQSDIPTDISGSQKHQQETSDPKSLSQQTDLSVDFAMSRKITELHDLVGPFGAQQTQVKTPFTKQNTPGSPKVYTDTVPVSTPDFPHGVTSPVMSGTTATPQTTSNVDDQLGVNSKTNTTPGAYSDATESRAYTQEDVRWCWFDKKSKTWVSFSEANNSDLEAEKQKNRKNSSKNVKIYDTWYRVFLKTMKMQRLKSRESTPVKRAVIPRAIKGMRKELVDKYMNLLSKGSYQSSNIRLMVVGNDRVGKTTLCQNMLKDKKFGNTNGTDGIDVFVHSYQIDTTTKKKEKLGQTEHVVALQKLACATVYGKPMWTEVEEKEEEQPEEEENMAEGAETDSVPHFSSRESIDVPVTPPVTTIPANTLENKFEQIDINQPINLSKTAHPVKSNYVVGKKTGEILIPDYVKRDVDCILDEADKLRLAGRAAEKDNIAYLSMWDFGGEKVFYDTHHVFLSKDAVYLLCFNVKEYQEKKNHQPILFWLQSIATYSECNGQCKGPPVILIGTHTDKMEGTEEEKEREFERICAEITSLDIVKPIRGQIMNYFCVDNSNASDTKFDDVLDAVIEAAKYQSQWKRDIPTKWLALEREIMKVKKHKVKTFQDIVNLDEKMEVPIGDEDEIRMFLSYLHLMGYIMYFDEDVGLDGPHRYKDLTIIIDPQWVIYAFRRLITNPKNIKSKGCNRMVMWNRYINDGLLTTPLIDELWKKGKMDTEDFLAYKAVLLPVMERLGLIAPPVSHKSKADCPENLKYYIVPSMLSDVNEKWVNDLTEAVGFQKTATLRFTLKDQFISLPVFHKLLAVCLSRFKLPPSLDLPEGHEFNQTDCIKKGFGCFEVNGAWKVILHHNNSGINVTLFTYSDKDSVIRAGVGVDVRIFLEETLLEVLRLQGQNAKNLTFVYHLGLDILQVHQAGKFRPVTQFDALGESDTMFLTGGKYLRKVDCYPWFCTQEEEGEPIPVAYFLPSHRQNLVPEEIHLARISKCICLRGEVGKEHFGLELGLQRHHICNIQAEYTGDAEQIYQILVKWKTLNRKGRISDIIKAMRKLDIDRKFFCQKGRVFD
ncbi:uncharacterized protein LOC132559926 [Ylistrum balloti]|uniref:uncharacterized protein LOC132559926 n=1 Tax=Ylistrum balloti TaxID=509963 RepID=UPI002905AE97|nr:uncharacterized protein LOC132559926 [Ylistrum balloti]